MHRDVNCETPQLCSLSLDDLLKNGEARSLLSIFGKKCWREVQSFSNPTCDTPLTISPHTTFIVVAQHDRIALSPSTVDGTGLPVLVGTCTGSGVETD